MTFEATLAKLAAGIGGAAGLWIIIRVEYHNYMMRHYWERIAHSMEKEAGLESPDTHPLVSWVWKKRRRVD